MTHWAFKYVGQSYEAIGACWGLVQACCRERYGVDMPGSRAAARIRGWCKVPQPQADSVVVMIGREGRHIGYIVEADGVLMLLHALHTGVESVPWYEAKGYRNVEVWRP